MIICRIRNIRKKNIFVLKLRIRDCSNSVIPNKFRRFGAVLCERLRDSFLAGAVLDKDYPVIQGGVMFLAIVFVLVNLLVDVLYAVIDPRIRVS